MQRINVLDIIEQEIEGISLVDASRLARRIMNMYDSSVRVVQDKARAEGRQSAIPKAAVAEESGFWFQGIAWNTAADEFIREDKKIQAIKEIRNISGLSLKEAKEAVEARERVLHY